MWRVFELASVGYMTGSSRCQVCFFSYLNGYFAYFFNVRHGMSVELSNFSQQRIIAVVLCAVGTCNDYLPLRIHPVTWKKSERMWLAISRVVSFTLDELRIRAWTEMKLSPADGHVEGGSGLSLLFGGLAAFDGFSSSRDKVTQK